MDIGIQQALGKAINTPLPTSWLGLAGMPPALPAWANIDRLSTTQIVNLQAQIGYDKSQWDYAKVGSKNELGRYQFTTTQLESYGLLAAGSNQYYGTDCINYKSCWTPVVIRKNTNSYANYLYEVDSVVAFLNSTISQEHLAYQIIYDIYNSLSLNGAITASDSEEVIAGMIAVGWDLGAGTQPTASNLQGSGAYAWRYFNVGTGAPSYNSGRYAVAVLSQ